MKPLNALITGSTKELTRILEEELRRVDFDPMIESVTVEELAEIGGSHDLVLLADVNLDRPLSEVAAETLTTTDRPVLIVCSRATGPEAMAAMKAGVRDVVLRDNLHRLGPAVRREVERSRTRRSVTRTAAASAANESRFREVLDDQSEFVVRWTPDGTRTFANRAYCEYFDGTPEEFIGTSFMDDMEEHNQHFIKDFLSGLSPEEPVATAEPRVVRPGGRTVIHEWINRGVFNDDGELIEIQSVGRDVTEQRRAEETERRQMLLVEVLRDTASALNSTLDLDEVFDRILANMGWVIPHNASAIFFVENVTAKVIRLAGWEELGIFDIPDSIPLNENEVSFLSSMAVTSQPVVIQDTAQNPIWEPGLRRLDWVRSFAAAPLFDESKIFGVLALFCERPDYFTESHVELLEGFASQAASASRNARLFEAVSNSRRELRRLSSMIVETQEDERRRISRELHDGVAQTLTGVIINAELLMNQVLAAGDGPPPEKLERVTALARQSLEQIRDLSQRLRPAMLDELGLVATLTWFSRRFEAWSEIEIHLTVDGMGDDRLENDLETALYRVVQESLNTVARFGSASRVEIELSRSPDAVRMVIEELRNGRDQVPLSLSPDDRDDLELLGIRERVVAVGGELTIESPADGGLTLDIRIPLD